jgi:hypothetical protein
MGYRGEIIGHRAGTELVRISARRTATVRFAGLESRKNQPDKHQLIEVRVARILQSNRIRSGVPDRIPFM